MKSAIMLLLTAKNLQNAMCLSLFTDKLFWVLIFFPVILQGCSVFSPSNPLGVFIFFWVFIFSKNVFLGVKLTPVGCQKKH